MHIVQSFPQAMSLGTAAVAEALPTAKLASAGLFRVRLPWLFDIQK